MTYVVCDDTGTSPYSTSMADRKIKTPHTDKATALASLHRLRAEQPQRSFALLGYSCHAYTYESEDD